MKVYPSIVLVSRRAKFPVPPMFRGVIEDESGRTLYRSRLYFTMREAGAAMRAKATKEGWTRVFVDSK